MDHYFSPRNCYVMEKPDIVGIAGDPGRGNFMVLYLRVHGEKIVAASFQTHGCCPSIAAGSVLSERLTGSTADEAMRWDERTINDALGGLPMHKRHCSGLAATALAKALEAWRAKRDGFADAGENGNEPHRCSGSGEEGARNMT